MSNETRLRKIVQDLDIPAPSGDEEVFSVTSVGGRDSHQVGIDDQGRPAVLLRLSGAGEGYEGSYPIRLRNMALRYGVKARIASEREIEERTYTILQCLSDDRGLQEYFVTVAAAFLDSVPESPSARDVASRVSRLVKLFESVQKRGIQSIQGLWAELFVLEQATGVRECLSAWYSDVSETYDLSLGRERGEIKSYSGPVRSHIFSHRQLHPPERSTVVIASVQVQSSSGGRSGSSLTESIIDRAGISGDAELEFQEQLAKRLGESYSTEIKKKFDYELALDSYEFFNPSDIPRLKRGLPEGVSELQHRSDLTGVAPAELPEGDELFRFLRPRS